MIVYTFYTCMSLIGVAECVNFAVDRLRSMTPDRWRYQINKSLDLGIFDRGLGFRAASLVS